MCCPYGTFCLPSTHRHKSAAYLPNLSSEEHGDPSRPEKPVDKSDALFSMYLDRSDEDDKKTTEKWKGETDAILIFVSRSYQPSPSSATFVLTLVYRLVFSRPLLRLFLPFPSRAFSRIHRTPQCSISEISFIYWPVTLPPIRRSLPHLIHLNFLRRNMQSWLTHSGF